MAASGALLITLLVVQPGIAEADPVRTAQWHLTFLSVQRAHQISRGQGVVVGVVDTGVDDRHPDLAGAIEGGIDLVDVGGNGHKDSDGHGTGMAGLIAARTSVGREGALGIAPQATILTVRSASSSRPFGNPAIDAAGIEWAARNGAKVICFASGGTDSVTYQRALTVAAELDVLVVAAVGNAPNDVRVQYPAASPGVLAAGGVDRNGDVAAVSVRGQAVDLVAPAVDITSTDRDGGYRTGTGTSDATAIIAGAAALVRSKYPHLNAQQVIDRLTSTATDKGPPGHDPDYGHGVLNLVAALTGDVRPSASGPVGDNDGPARTKFIVGAISVVALLAAGALVGGVLFARSRRT